MSGSSSPVEADVADDSKKKARGGKRSVTHLSKAQLARKRANDREAQRNIRQRTKEHIETLERKVRELEAIHASSPANPAVERIFRRNQELEAEIHSLRAQLRAATMPLSPGGSHAADALMGAGRGADWMTGVAPPPPTVSAPESWQTPEASAAPNPAYAGMYAGMQPPLGYLHADNTPASYPAQPPSNRISGTRCPPRRPRAAITSRPTSLRRPITVLRRRRRNAIRVPWVRPLRPIKDTRFHMSPFGIRSRSSSSRRRRRRRSNHSSNRSRSSTPNSRRRLPMPGR